jgi:hypothetical protein
MSPLQHPDGSPGVSDSPENGLIVADDEAPESLTLVLNGTEYRVQPGAMTLAELRALPYPPISPDYDLWLETPAGEDIFLSDAEEVQLRDGMRLLAVPRSILAGRPAEGRLGCVSRPAATAVPGSAASRGPSRSGTSC